ncbi:hypothetical protein BRADI_4g24372v3 [Brachypodium distachyon]|uniref:Uncharacterized protein n=1 Tax=Brachypodium distachyon TaxID=15368 RepID=A0A2K2CPZ8_BRADI|nr:hypothetical protein BRADI_4g24372v3 [Brachypodium distachyon]
MHSILRNKQKIPCVGLHINRRAASDGSVSPYIPGGPWLVRSRFVAPEGKQGPSSFLLLVQKMCSSISTPCEL